MSDWDFLYEMSARGYSAADIADAAGSGAAPWEWEALARQEMAVRPPGQPQGPAHAPPDTRPATEKKSHPSKEEIAQLPPFAGLGLDRIFVVRSHAQWLHASAAIASEQVVGFDTESRPTWAKGAPRSGPHLLQFALHDRAYLVQAPLFGQIIESLRTVLESDRILKVGFGLNSDRGPLVRTLGIRLKGTVDLSQTLRPLGYRQKLGVRAATAVVLREHLPKPLRITTSDWAQPHLSDRQRSYAADDAFAALRIHRAIGPEHR